MLRAPQNSGINRNGPIRTQTDAIRGPREMDQQAAIEAVFSDPRIEGMNELYAVIAARMASGESFEEAYNRMIQGGGTTANTWIRFCVQCAGRFEEPPEEADFLTVLERFCSSRID